MSELYNRINEICKARGTNITALCRKAGVSRATLSELNAGRTKTLTLETAQKLADALEVSLNFLRGNFDDEAPIEFTVSTDEIRDYLQKKKVPTQMGEHSEDPDIRRIERAKARMTEKEWKHQMEIISASFGDYFSDDYEDDDVDE